MTTIYIYKCDGCGKEFGRDARLIAVRAEVNSFGRNACFRTENNGIQYEGTYFTKDLCFDCALSLGVIHERAEKPPEDIKRDEDKLYEIIQNMVASMMPPN